MPSPTPTATLPTVPAVVPVAAARRSASRIVGSLVAAVLAVAALVASYVLGVLEPAGRRLDDAVMTAAMDLGAPWRGSMLTLLDVVTVPTVALAVLALVSLALVRGQRRRAAGVVALVLGSQAATQVLKAVLPRAGDPEGNSLPSGHVTLVVALGVALLVALPRALRPLAGVVVAGATALTGVATLVAGWHRPSDLVAAVAVVVIAAAAWGLADALGRPRGSGGTPLTPSVRHGTQPRGARASTTWST